VATGKRYNTSCVETGAEVAPLVSADDCGDAGTCRTVQLTLPAQ
jgi:hypothetical protein